MLEHRQQTDQTAVGNGRDHAGRFALGNAGGPGNPLARRVAHLRSLLLEAVTDDDLRAIARALVERAKAGEVAAARELLERLLGRPEAIDLAVRLEALEEVLLAKGVFEKLEALERWRRL